MKKKKIILAVVVLAIASLITVPRIIKNNRIRNEIKPTVESWEKKNNISVNSYSATKNSNGYHITIVWDDFEKLTPSEMEKVIRNWNSDHTYYLEYILAYGHKYHIYRGGVYSYASEKQIVPQQSSIASSGSSSSSSQKTAKCNYCNGTGKVNGDKCPWCNGSGKTYDNAFNDALGK